MFKKVIFEKIVGNEIFGFLPDFGEKSIFRKKKFLKTDQQNRTIRIGYIRKAT